MLEKAAIEYLKKKGYFVSKKENLSKGFRLAKFGVLQAIRHLEDNAVSSGRDVIISDGWYNDIVGTLKYCKEDLDSISKEL